MVAFYDPDLLVLDPWLPDLDGLAGYQALRASGIRTKVRVYPPATRSGRFATAGQNPLSNRSVLPWG